MKRGMAVVAWWTKGIGLAVFCWGCATGSGSRFLAESLPPCGVPTAGPANWRQVISGDLSFCVPADWKPSGSHGWRGDGGSITWGYGAPKARRVSVTTVVPADGLPGSPPPFPGNTNRLSETIGGVAVDLWITEVGGKIFTGAQWKEPQRLYMTGEASSQVQAQRQLNVFRTARLKEKIS
jgi:hypothetical protein